MNEITVHRSLVTPRPMSIITPRTCARVKVISRVVVIVVIVVVVSIEIAIHVSRDVGI